MWQTHPPRFGFVAPASWSLASSRSILACCTCRCFDSCCYQQQQQRQRQRCQHFQRQHEERTPCHTAQSYIMSEERGHTDIHSHPTSIPFVLELLGLEWLRFFLKIAVTRCLHGCEIFGSGLARLSAIHMLLRYTVCWDRCRPFGSPLELRAVNIYIES